MFFELIFGIDGVDEQGKCSRREEGKDRKIMVFFGHEDDGGG